MQRCCSQRRRRVVRCHGSKVRKLRKLGTSRVARCDALNCNHRFLQRRQSRQLATLEGPRSAYPLESSPAVWQTGARANGPAWHLLQICKRLNVAICDIYQRARYLRQICRSVERRGSPSFGGRCGKCRNLRHLRNRRAPRGRAGQKSEGVSGTDRRLPHSRIFFVATRVFGRLERLAA